MPMTIFITTFLTFFLDGKIVKKEIVELDNYSAFSSIIIYVSAILLHNVNLVLCIWLALKGKALKNILNFGISLKLKGNYLKEFRDRSLQHSLTLGFAFVVLSSSNYIAIMNWSLASVILYPIYAYPSVVLFSFVSFAKNFEIFSTAQLEQLQAEVEMITSEHCVDDDDGRIISLKYKNILDLVELFNANVGPQLTLAICCVASMFVTQARYKSKFLKAMKSIFFFLAVFHVCSRCGASFSP